MAGDEGMSAAVPRETQPAALAKEPLWHQEAAFTQGRREANHL